MKSNSMFNSFSIVIPIYNEEEILLESVNSIISMCERTELTYELLLIENGSTDKTLEIAQSLSNMNNSIKVHSLNQANYGNALKNGFSLAIYDLVVAFDIDYYSETFLITSLQLESEFSAITASKRLQTSEDARRLIRRVATNFFVYLLKVLFNTDLSDTHGMKAIKKTEINKFIEQVVSTQDIFDTELLLRIERNGGKVKEVPAKINEIRPSVSLIYKRIPRTLKSLIKLRYIFYMESLKTKNL
jgi:glycosyltransferase involved in cell wall biosynthesis